jgi:hypothetical protein
MAATWATRSAHGSNDTLATAAVELAREHDEVPILIQEVRQATLALTQAAAAVTEDRMLVPDRLAKSLRHLLVVYVIGKRLNGARTTDPGKETNDELEPRRPDRVRVGPRSDP